MSDPFEKRARYGATAIARLLVSAGVQAACLLAGPLTTTAQHIPVGSADEAYLRLLSLDGHLTGNSFSVRPISAPRVSRPTTRQFWSTWRDQVLLGHRPRRVLDLGLFDPQAGVSLVSARPQATNDGALWEGRGVTTWMTAGLFLKLGVVGVTVRPLVAYTQNAAYAPSPHPVTGYARLVDPSPFLYPFLGGQTIDMPQRFGDAGFFTVDPGQSHAGIQVGFFEAGVSTENKWWGPGRFNAIILSNNAPGFPHVFVRSGRPIDTFFGSLEFEYFSGRLRESKFFDGDPANDERNITGATLSYGPEFVSGLSVGVARTYMSNRRPTDPFFSRDVFRVFSSPFKRDASNLPSLDDFRDQMISLYARWVMPADGFEMYGEWARGDHSYNLRDLLVEPEHGSGYTLGFQKILSRTGTARWTLAGEMTRLSAPRTVLNRSFGAGFFYVHYQVPQGYTHHGQVIGAGIGPGSNAQYLFLERFSEGGNIGFRFSRVVFDKDRIYRNSFSQHSTETEFSAEITGYALRGRSEIGFTAGVARRLNVNLAQDADEWNLRVSLRYRLILGWRR